MTFAAMTDNDILAYVRKKRAETIEECAGVVESFSQDGERIFIEVKSVARALRALKDKP